MLNLLKFRDLAAYEDGRDPGLSGRDAYLSGRIPKKLYATASSPTEGTIAAIGVVPAAPELKSISLVPVTFRIAAI